MTSVFTVTSKLRFADCDPVGIAFCPRLVGHVDGVVEDWFGGLLDHSIEVMHSLMRWGIPIAAVNVNFLRHAELGGIIEWYLTVRSQNIPSQTRSIRARLTDGEDLMLAEPKPVHTSIEREPTASEQFLDELGKSREPRISEVSGTAANRSIE